MAKLLNYLGFISCFIVELHEPVFKYFFVLNKINRNGDEFYRGHKIVINSRKYRYFNVFLDDVSDSLNARFGAVRSIHTPINGHKIQSLDQIEDGKTYVAAGSGRFVRLKYSH